MRKLGDILQKKVQQMRERMDMTMGRDEKIRMISGTAEVAIENMMECFGFGIKDTYMGVSHLERDIRGWLESNLSDGGGNEENT